MGCLEFWSSRGEVGSRARPGRSLRQKGQGKELEGSEVAKLLG